jgi:hypothetical protein
MPSLQNPLEVAYYLSTNLIQFSCRKSIVSTQGHGLEPIFADFIVPLDVHVFRLIAVKAVKEEPIGTGNVLDGWHCVFIAARLLIVPHQRSFFASFRTAAALLPF